MVLTQLCRPRWQTTGTVGFHTTMVLTQPEKKAFDDRRSCTKFPYHYGSYATNTHTRKTKTATFCFHTTMVLTQPINKIASALDIDFGFHTTMVLTQLDCF